MQAGFELNVPVRKCDAAPKTTAITSTGFVSVDSRSVVLDSIKKAEDGNGYIVRLYEACGGGGAVNIQFAKAIKQVFACDLMENNEESVAVQDKGFAFETAPYRIHSFRVID